MITAITGWRWVPDFGMAIKLFSWCRPSGKIRQPLQLEMIWMSTAELAVSMTPQFQSNVNFTRKFPIDGGRPLHPAT
ncbi:MAG: hypothetical protein NTV11_11290 [Rhodocyclales bacterium]|nr:hypothetical protein [Rhodocyclales bacterium]